MIRRLQAKSYPVAGMADNEMTEVHIRYTAGAGAAHSGCDRAPLCVSRAPGALLNFLFRIGGRWNTGMFHYRNQSAA